MQYDSVINLNGRELSIGAPSYFIVDVGSNHDGDLERAKELIWLAKGAGADAVKFQHFLAKHIVSDFGFRSLGGQLSHQAGWEKPVYQVYEQYQTDRSWTPVLVETARAAGIDFITTPYDFEAIETFAPLVPAFKIGSGDITWLQSVEHIAKQGRPVLLATGAATAEDVSRAVATILKHNRQIVLMQCNTNYTGSIDNFQYVNLRVLQSFALSYPNMLLGLSDHTPGHAAVLGAIALGARVIEKHFTDDTNRKGPDHAYAMDPDACREMITRSRELEMALGDGIKRIEANEQDTVVVQRRCIRLTRNMTKGGIISADDIEFLRPAPRGALKPYEMNRALGKPLRVDKVAGAALYASDIEN
jgi:N-acetylneuraminate synthase